MGETRITVNAADEVIKIFKITDTRVDVGGNQGLETFTQDIIPSSGDVTPFGDDLILKDEVKGKEKITVLFS